MNTKIKARPRERATACEEGARADNTEVAQTDFEQYMTPGRSTLRE